MEKFGTGQRKVHWQDLLERMGNEGSNSWGFKTDPESFPIVRFKKDASWSAVNFSEMQF